MSRLSVFGLIAVGIMLLSHVFEERHRLFLLAFAGGCVLAAIYGFLQGAWPLGVVEAIWAAVAVRRWQRKAHA